MDIREFTQQVHFRAQQAAQAVYDCYTPELIERIREEMQEGDLLVISSRRCRLFRNGQWIENGLTCLLSEILITELPTSFMICEIRKGCAD